jgi:excisionase family DNA binding protein
VTGLAQALLAELGPDDLAELARRLAPYLPTPPNGAGGWLTTAQAAEHLGISVHALHRLTAARSIPFSQDGPGARCYFRQSDLNEWRSA